MPDIHISLTARNHSNCKLRAENVTPTSSERLVSNSIARLNTKIQNLDHPYSAIATPNMQNYNFMLKMWLHLLHTETDYHKSSILARTESIGLSGEDITHLRGEGYHRNPMDFFSHNNSTAAASFNIFTLHIKRGLDMIAVHREQAAEFGLKHIPEINMHVTMNARHRVDVYEMPDNKGILIITNVVEESLLARVLSSVWSYLDMFGIKEKLRATNIAESKFLQFCKVLYDEDLEAFHNFIDVITAEAEAYQNSPEYIEAQLIACQRATSERQKINATNRIKNIQRDVQEYENSITRLYNDLRESELRLMVINLGAVETDKNITELGTFLQKAKNTVKLVKVDAQKGTLVLEITTPLSTYRRKDVEMYYKPNKTSTNHITRYPKIVEAFKKTFIDEEYDLITTTRVMLALSLGGDYSARGVGDFYSAYEEGNSDLPQRFGNPHIERHNCFSGSKREIDKALSTSNYVMAVAQLISACSSITFTDSTVISSFTSRINGNDSETPIFKRRSDGEMFSLDQLYDICTNEAIAKLVTKSVESMTARDNAIQPNAAPTQTTPPIDLHWLDDTATPIAWQEAVNELHTDTVTTQAILDQPDLPNPLHVDLPDFI